MAQSRQNEAVLSPRDDADETASAPPASIPNLSEYEFYFSSGNYDRRYPVANAHVLRRVAAHLPRNGHVLDFGCGSGRYLLALREQAGTAAGFDICSAARAGLRRKLAAEDIAAIHVLGPDLAELDRHVSRYGLGDIVLCLFGVLSHIEGRAARSATLRRLRGLLKPECGRLIISVPNRRRRFRAEQRAGSAGTGGEIRYKRRCGNQSVELSYQLFDVPSFRAELNGAGFELESVAAESLFPEALVANSAVLRRIDGLAASMLPAGLGYGLLGVARPAASEGAL